MASDRARSIDLNADLGEGCPWDEPLLRRVTSAGISCGAHAGHPGAIRATLRMAIERGVVLGAHPGFADREHFGRREHPASARQARDLIVGQVEGLRALAATEGGILRFLKPHGALYNQAQRQAEIAEGVVSAARGLGLPVLGLPGGCVEERANECGVGFVAEGFADRRYGEDGRLVPRSHPGAILHDPAEIAAQVVRLVDRGIATLCLHGDHPDSVATADLVLGALRDVGIIAKGFAP